MSQNKQILDYLESHRSICPQTALREFGCMRLAARIEELRKRGHNITSIICQEWSAKQEKFVKFCRYRLEG